MSGSANFWDDGSVGNYWSDYLDRYPNSSEIGHTGIGKTPYVIDQDNIDRYPLMLPYDIDKDEIALSTREPLIEPKTEPLPTPFIAGISALSVIGVAYAYSTIIGIGVNFRIKWLVYASKW